MHKKTHILIASTQNPGYGGASTNAYSLIKYLRSTKKYIVSGLFFYCDRDKPIDIHNIGGIFGYYKKYDEAMILQNILNYYHSLPDICLAKNYVAPILCKKIFKCKVIYLVAGIANPLIDEFETFIQNPYYVEPFKQEITCIEYSDLVVLNSPITSNVFKILYPMYQNKVYHHIVDTSRIIMTYEHNEISKDFHLLACCSDFSRPKKNMMFLLDLFQHDPFFQQCTKCFIGNGSETFTDLSLSHCLPLSSHEEVTKYMSKSKLLLIPSLNEANSNTIREGLHYNCVPIITKNVGFWECFPNELVCESYEFNEWTMKIKYALQNYDALVKIPIDYSSMSISVDHFVSQIKNL